MDAHQTRVEMQNLKHFFFPLRGLEWKGTPKISYRFRRTEFAVSCLCIHKRVFLVHNHIVDTSTDLLNRLLEVAQPVSITALCLTKFCIEIREIISMCVGSDSSRGPHISLPFDISAATCGLYRVFRDL